MQAVLERTLRTHTCLSDGDWLPVRHEGVTYELVARGLEPAPALTLVHTDLEVREDQRRGRGQGQGWGQVGLGSGSGSGPSGEGGAFSPVCVKYALMLCCYRLCAR